MRDGLHQPAVTSSDVTLGGFTEEGQLKLWPAWALPEPGRWVAGRRANGISVFGDPDDTNDEHALWSSMLSAGVPSPWRRTAAPLTPAWAGVVVGNTDVIAIASDIGDHIGSDISLLDLNQPSAWRSTGVSLLTPRITTSVAVCAGFLFVVGGELRPEQNPMPTAAVESAAVTAAGVGVMTRSADLTAAGATLKRTHASLACTAHRLYVIGGETANFPSTGSVTVLSGIIQADGSVTAWEEEPSLLYPVGRAASVVVGGRLVVAGGINATRLDSVTFAELDAEGHVLAWRTEGNPKLPVGVQDATAVLLEEP